MNKEESINLENEESNKCCGSQSGQEHGHGGCNCSGEHDDDGCNCNGEHDHSKGGCNCHGSGHDHEHEHHDTVTLVLDDGSELICPIVDIFEMNSKEYIALLHPVDETVLLYHFHDYEDGTIEINAIDDDAEYELVSKALMSFLEEESQEE